MEDPAFSMELLEATIVEAERDENSFGEKAGIFAATNHLCADFSSYIDECTKLDRNYAKEKLRQYRWHVSAMLGFDINNGHSKSQHHVWALTAIDSLKNAMSGAIWEHS